MGRGRRPEKMNLENREGDAGGWMALTVAEATLSEASNRGRYPPIQDHSDRRLPWNARSATPRPTLEAGLCSCRQLCSDGSRPLACLTLPGHSKETAPSPLTARIRSSAGASCARPAGGGVGRGQRTLPRRDWLRGVADGRKPRRATSAGSESCTPVSGVVASWLFRAVGETGSLPAEVSGAAGLGGERGHSCPQGFGRRTI